MIYNRKIDDVKRSGFDGKCKRCPKKQKGLIRITFEVPAPKLWEDRYVCNSCWLKLSKGRKLMYSIKKFLDK